jgi:hypothetical protein
LRRQLKEVVRHVSATRSLRTAARARLPECNSNKGPGENL